MEENNFVENNIVYLSLWNQKEGKYKIKEIRNINTGMEEEELIAECFTFEVAQKICFILSFEKFSFK